MKNRAYLSQPEDLILSAKGMRFTETDIYFYRWRRDQSFKSGTAGSQLCPSQRSCLVFTASITALCFHGKLRQSISPFLKTKELVSLSFPVVTNHNPLDFYVFTPSCSLASLTPELCCSVFYFYMNSRMVFLDFFISPQQKYIKNLINRKLFFSFIIS